MNVYAVLLGTLIVAIGILMNLISKTNESLSFPLESFKILASTEFNQSIDQPFRGKTAIITGSTSGLGLSIATYLYRLGATVIIASRSLEKCHKSMIDIQNKEKLTTGKLIPFVLDTSNMESIKDFSQYIRTNHSTINILINNAGIHRFITDEILGSAQNYDIVFATNYLGHFLLTELLIPALESGAIESGSKSTIINISSQYHFESDGSMLKPPIHSPYDSQNQNDWIPAARSDLDTISKRILCYANSKLAQVIHAKELQKRLDHQKKNIRINSVCPGVMRTHMSQNRPGGKIVGHFIYPSEIGATVIMHTLLDKSLRGGEFLTNSRPIPYLNYAWLSHFAGKFGLRSFFAHCIFLELVIIFQPFLFSPGIMESSYESKNDSLAKNFYEWSKRQVSPWL